MPEDDRSKTVQLPPVGEGNDVFRQAVTCIRLPEALAGHLLRDRLHLTRVDIRSVTLADLRGVIAQLEEPIAALADEAAARASVTALRKLVG